MTEEVEAEFFSNEKFSLLAMDAIAFGKISLPKNEKQKDILEGFYHEFDALFQGLPHKGKEKLLALAIRTLAKYGANWELGNHKTPGENITMLQK